MNGITLFVGGLLLGVLIALSVISRMPSGPSVTVSTESKLVTKESTAISTSTLPSTTSSTLKPIPALSLFGNLDTKSTSTIAAKKETVRVPAVAKVNEVSKVIIPVKSDIVSSADKPNVDLTPKTRWVPGKESDFTKLKGVSGTSAVTVSTTIDSVDQSAGFEGLKKKLRPGKLTREERKERRRDREAGASPVVASSLNSSEAKVTDKPNPLIPYHSQASTDFSTFKAYIPTMDQAIAGAKSSGKKLPDMSLQKGIIEKENLKLHFCNGVFEAYSASYLTTKKHMLSVASETYNLSWVNCEMASFIHMKESNKFYNNPQNEGVVMQSLDVIDFSVIHLSAFERSSKKYKDILWKTKEDRNNAWKKIPPVIEAAKRLEAINNPKSPTYRKINYSPEAQRTVVIMPFLGGAMGAGHSELGNRFEYLKACFWSFYEFIPNIVAGVTRQEDVDWCMKESGLPFYDVILLPPLPKSAGLPVGTTQQTKMRLVDGRWDFDYVFFTESDQILISRELQVMYEHLKRYPGHMMLPHRLMPYSYRVIDEIHKKPVKTYIENTWMNQSCCLQRQNCVERKTWLGIKAPEVPVINYYGLYVPLGNVNFLDEHYRYCKLTPYVGEYCP